MKKMKTNVLGKTPAVCGIMISIPVILFSISGFARNKYALSQQKDSAAMTSEMEYSKSSNFEADLRAGYIIGSVPGAGVQGEYSQSPNLKLGIALLAGSRELKDEVAATSTYFKTDIDKVNLSGQVLEAYAKYYTGETFALTGGIALRNIEGEIIISSVDEKSMVHTNSKGTSVVAKFGLGNYWKLATGFTIGCEWIGYMSPLSSSFSSSSDQKGVLSASMKENEKIANDLGKTFATLGTTQLLNLSLGYRF